MPNGDYEQRVDAMRDGQWCTDETTGARYFEPSPRDTPGDYERKGNGGYEGICAACRQYVGPNDPSVILYASGEVGGIFHLAHAPTGPQWFGVGEEAPDL